MNRWMLVGFAAVALVGLMLSTADAGILRTCRPVTTCACGSRQAGYRLCRCHLQAGDHLCGRHLQTGYHLCPW